MPKRELTPEQMLIETARLGIEAEAFMASSLGRYLIESAEIRIEDNTAKLVACDADDVHNNMTFRSEIKVGELFIQWLNAAVNSGRNAHKELDGNDTADY